MNNQNHHNSHFFDGFLLGIAVGAAAVFLFGTKPGKNLLKIISEQGIDGLTNLMEEYNLDATEDDLEDEIDGAGEEVEIKSKLDEKVEKSEPQASVEEVKTATKKRFFKRFKK
jgi:gas vesicle protein